MQATSSQDSSSVVSRSHSTESKSEELPTPSNPPPVSTESHTRRKERKKRKQQQSPAPRPTIIPRSVRLERPEHVFLLELPEFIGQELLAQHKSEENDSYSDDHNSELEFYLKSRDLKTYECRWKGESMMAKLTKLPCIVEAYKTLDGGENIMKCADIAGKLTVCHERGHVSSIDRIDEHSGLTAPSLKIQRRWDDEQRVCQCDDNSSQQSPNDGLNGGGVSSSSMTTSLSSLRKDRDGDVSMDNGAIPSHESSDICSVCEKCGKIPKSLMTEVSAELYRRIEKQEDRVWELIEVTDDEAEEQTDGDDDDDDPDDSDMSEDSSGMDESEESEYETDDEDVSDLQYFNDLAGMIDEEDDSIMMDGNDTTTSVRRNEMDVGSMMVGDLSSNPMRSDLNEDDHNQDPFLSILSDNDDVSRQLGGMDSGSSNSGRLSSRVMNTAVSSATVQRGNHGRSQTEASSLLISDDREMETDFFFDDDDDFDDMEAQLSGEHQNNGSSSFSNANDHSGQASSPARSDGMTGQSSSSSLSAIPHSAEYSRLQREIDAKTEELSRCSNRYLRSRLESQIAELKAQQSRID